MITIEQLTKRREQLVTTHREALAAMEQARGAISIIDEMVQTLQAEANGGGNNVEATDSPERQLSS
jgi:hypothetical protein